MADLRGFNANTVEPSKEMELIPNGKYLAAICQSEFKATKNGRGKYLECVLEILEGPYKGRKLWHTMNLVNDKDQTVQIAKRDLSAICHAVGVMEPGDSQALHRLPMIISVKAVKRDDNGELQAKIKGFYSKNDPAATAAEPVTAAASDAAPWIKR